MRISADPADLDLALIHDVLSREAYWSRGIPRATLDRALANSVCLGGFVASDGFVVEAVVQVPRPAVVGCGALAVDEEEPRLPLVRRSLRAPRSFAEHEGAHQPTRIPDLDLLDAGRALHQECDGHMPKLLDALEMVALSEKDAESKEFKQDALNARAILDAVEKEADAVPVE